MYKYSKKAERKYFQCETESFLFAAFALSDEGLGFLKNKPDNNKDLDKMNRILGDLRSLKEQAVLSLELMSQGKVPKMDDGSESQELDKGSDKENGSPEAEEIQATCDL